MSKLFGRVGTSAMKYQFELTVNSLHMSIPLTTPMCVKWTRGPRTATNQPVAGVNGEYNWPAGKAMMIIATMYFKKNSFQEKKSKLTVKQLLGKDLKSVGQVEIDLAQFCGEGETTKTIQLKLQKCSDKGAYLKCTMKSRWLKQLADGADDTASQMSGASSVDARSESAMPHMHAHHTAGGDVANLNDLDGMEEEEHDDTEYSTSRASPSTSRASPSASPSASTGVESRPVRIVSYDPSSTSVNAAMSTPSRSMTGGVGGLNSSPAHAGGGSMMSSIPSTPNNNAQAMATIHNLQLQLDTLNQTLATKDAQLNQRENELDVLKLKIADLTVNWNAERTQASKLSGLQSQLSQLQTSYDTVVREKHDLETEHEQALVRVRTELVEMTKKCEEIQRHHLDAERQLAQTKVELEQTKMKLNAAESAVSVAPSAFAPFASVTSAFAPFASVTSAFGTFSPSPATQFGPTSPSSTGADRSQLESQVRSLRAELTEASALTHELETFQQLENVESKARQTGVEHAKELVVTVASESDSPSLSRRLSQTHELETFQQLENVEAPAANMELLALLSDSDRTQILLGLDCRSLLKLAATSKQWMRIIAPADSQENSNSEGENPATAPLHRIDIIPSWWRRHYQCATYHESHPLPALVSRFATLRIIFNSLTEQASLSAASLLLSSSPLNLQILELWNMDSGAALSLLSSSLLKRSLRYVQILRVRMTPELLEAAVTGFLCPDYCLMIGTSVVASILSASTSPPIGAGTADGSEVASTPQAAVSAKSLPLSISGTHVQTQANAGALNTTWSNLNSMILINGTVEELVAVSRWFPALLRICITSKLLEQPTALQSVFSSFSHHLVSLSINRITWPDVDPVGDNNLPASASTARTGSAIASCNFSQSSTGSDAVLTFDDVVSAFRALPSIRWLSLYFCENVNCVVLALLQPDCCPTIRYLRFAGQPPSTVLLSRLCHKPESALERVWLWLESGYMPNRWKGFVTPRQYVQIPKVCLAPSLLWNALSFSAEDDQRRFDDEKADPYYGFLD